jgi:hypothetical protein
MAYAVIHTRSASPHSTVTLPEFERDSKTPAGVFYGSTIRRQAGETLQICPNLL